MAKKNEVVVSASEQDLAILRESFPTEPSSSRITLPRLGIYSQDVTEGTGKSLKVIAEQGQFYTESPSEELNEDGKRVWEKTIIGTEFEGCILFQRKQLSHYDQASELFTSSPIYDTDDEVIPLWCDKQEVDKGLPKELQAKEKYAGKNSKGKYMTTLKDNRILYVEYEGKVYQMSVHGSSMYAYSDYRKKVLGALAPCEVITKFGSENQEKGKIKWAQVTYAKKRLLNAKEVAEVMEKVKEISATVKAEKSQYSNRSAEDKKSEDEFAKKF